MSIHLSQHTATQLMSIYLSQHNAAHYNTLQRTATQLMSIHLSQHTAANCNTLQHTATHLMSIHLSQHFELHSRQFCIVLAATKKRLLNSNAQPSAHIVAGCCSVVLQRVAVCCSVLLCTAAQRAALSTHTGDRGLIGKKCLALFFLRILAVTNHRMPA